MDIQWNAPKPIARKLNQPEGASSYYLDAYASGDLALARQIWRDHGDKIRRDREIDRRNWPSSWNWWPLALASRLLASDEGERPPLVQALVRYCESQLNRREPKHDLWGQEILSRIYPWPVAAMALVYDWAKEKKVAPAVAALTDLLTAHAYTLALFSLPHPYPQSAARALYVCAPGMRSNKFEQGRQISFITSCILNAGNVRGNRAALVSTANPKSRVDWSSRVAWAASHAYLPEAERKKLLAHVETGEHAQEIVDKMQGLGVAFRTPVQVWRYKNGDYVALAKRNVQGSTPPILAMTRVDGRYHHLSVHPPELRGHGGRRLGDPSKCWREGDRARVYFEDAVLGPASGPETLEGSIPAPPEDDASELHYAVRISPEGTGFLDRAKRREDVLRFARAVATLAQDRPKRGIDKHAQAIEVLVGQGDLERIYRRARAIERLEPTDAQQERIRRTAAHVVDFYEWWA